MTEKTMIDNSAGTNAASSELAERCAHAMFERDFASQAMGIRLESVDAGCARLSMAVRRDMLNGFHTCHGGFLFALADSAFAFACNARDQATVAAACSIEYLRPAHEGDVLTAIAKEAALSGRTGIYDISIVDSAGILIALFRGKSHAIKGEVIGCVPRI